MSESKRPAAASGAAATTWSGWILKTLVALAATAGAALLAALMLVATALAMAYLSAEHAIAKHEVYAEVRGQQVPMRVTPLPFVPHRYHRG